MQTADQVVEGLPWRWNTQGRIFIIGGLGYMFDAWDVVLVAFLIPLLADDWGVSKAQLGLLASAGLIGMAVGAFLWGTVADAVGRRRAFSYTVLTFAIFSLLGALAPWYWWLLVTRFIAGLGLGGCIPVDYALVSEFTPRKVRGRVLTALDVWWPIGATLGGLISTALLPLDSWRILLAVMVLPALLTFWIRRSVPESAFFLIRHGRKREAQEVIDHLIERTGATVGPWEFPPASTASRLSPSAFLRQLRSVWAFDWRRTLLAWALFTTVLFHYYGVIIWMPSILVEQGLGNYAAFLSATLLTGIGVAGVLISAWLVDVVGRKWVIVASGLIAALAMVFFATQLGVRGPALTGLALYGFAIEFTIPAMYCYVPELYPTRMRASGFGWASTSSRAAAALVPLIFGSLLWPTFGLLGTFIITGALLAMALIYVAAAGPETKGRALDAAETGHVEATT